MPSTQFARVSAYSAQKVAGVLAEANRDNGACPHVDDPQPAIWLIGNVKTVAKAVSTHMSVKAPVLTTDGKERRRKRRADHRCLVAGVLSYPTPFSHLDDLEANLSNHSAALFLAERINNWIYDSTSWLQDSWKDNLAAVVEHRDESHPHIHFFVVGDAQRLHPGLRAELVENRRIDDPKKRMEAHKKGLRLWLDDYHRQIGKKHGLTRGDGSSRPIWRIRDRAVRATLIKIQSERAGDRDEQQRAVLAAQYEDIYEKINLIPRARMRF